MNTNVLCGAEAQSWNGQTMRCTKPKDHKIEDHWDTDHRTGWTTPEDAAERQLIQMIDNACFHGKGGKTLGWTRRLIELVEERVREQVAHEQAEREGAQAA